MYYVSRQLEVVSVLLTMEAFDPPHTAEATAVAIENLLERWGLQGLVNRATTDNASVMISAFEDRLKMDRLPCAAHWLQLTLSDCLFSPTSASPELRAFIAKCRALVGHFSHSAAATDMLLRLQGKSALRPIQDVETRWNSTYLMLERLQHLKDAVIRYSMEVDGLDGEQWVAVGDRAFWQVIDELVAVLQPFHSTTNKWQGDADKSTAISAVYTQMLQLRHRLETAESYKVGIGQVVRRVAAFHPGVIALRQSLLASLDERWGEGSIAGEQLSLYRCAALLDPRYKGHLLLHPEGSADDNKQELRAFLRERVPEMVAALRSRVLDEEDGSASGSDGGAAVGAAKAARDPMVAESDDDAEFYALVPSSVGEDGAREGTVEAGHVEDKVLCDMVKAELELFWGKVYDDVNFSLSRQADPIAWWRAQAAGGRMRNLAIVAISVLSIPATSACVERLFSAAKHQITDTRNRLGKERVRQLMFVSQNWREELRQLSANEEQEYKQRHKKREAARQQGLKEAKRARRMAATDSADVGGGSGGEVQVVAVIDEQQRASQQTQQRRGSLDGYLINNRSK
jgi:hypothetical protein